MVQHTDQSAFGARSWGFVRESLPESDLRAGNKQVWVSGLKRAGWLAGLALVAATGLQTGLAEAASCDNRTELSSPTTYPWNTIGALSIGDGRGTATVVGPYMALTCGHCVYNREEGYYRTVDLTVHPGQYKDSSGTLIRPYGSRTALHKRTNSKYADPSYSPVSDVDYGAIQFACPFEDLNTYMPLVFDYDAYYINMSGYPSEDLPYDAKYDQWWGHGDVTDLYDRRMIYDARSTGGASGAPTWAYNSADGRRLVAVNRGHTNSCDGVGTRLVWQNEDLINTWLDWTPTLAEKTDAGCLGTLIAKSFSELVAYYQANPSNLLSAQQLHVVAPPQQKASAPTYKVVQVIENNRYKWGEYLVNPSDPNSNRYLRMLLPEQRWLSVYDARVLLTASQKWSAQTPSGNYTEIVPEGTAAVEAMPMPIEDDPGQTAPDTTKDQPLN